MKRVPTPELLDTDSGTPSEIAASLSDLHRINRWFGGIGVTRHMLQRITGERMRTLSLLEVAAGSGHTPQLASRALERNGIHVNLTFMDRAPTHRVAMIINDIVRSPIHLALVYAGTPLYRSRLTRHDAPASVRQAYTPDEIRDLVQQAGPSRIDITRHYLFRMGVIAWK